MTAPAHTVSGPRALAVALLVLVAASRLLLIPGQPWEQDEALFAVASIHTDIANHWPHPPGFPAWVAVGKLGLAALGDPVRALQLVSAVASVATVALLAHLLAMLLGWRAGWAAAMLYAFAPGVWFHAPRAFSTTPALFLAVAAVAAWRRPGTASWMAGCALLAGALLVRPVLAPLLLLAGVAAASLRRERPAAWLRGATLVTVLVVAGFAPLVISSGGLRPFLAAVAEHAAAHGGALHLASWRPADLGLVTAMGGLLPALAAVCLAGLGLASMARDHRHLAVWWLLVTLATVAWLLLAHNRTYPRYALPTLLLLAGPVLAGLTRLLRSERAATAVACAAVVAGAVWTAPAVASQATTPFPPLAALAAAQEMPGTHAVVVEGLLSPFGDLLNVAGRAERPAFSRPLVAEGRVPLAKLGGRWAMVGADGAPATLVPAPGGPFVAASAASPRLAALAQGRYLQAWATPRGAILLDATTGPRPGPVAVDRPVHLLLQPTPPGSRLGIILDVSGAPARVDVIVGGKPLAGASLSPGRHRYALPLPGIRGPAASLPTPAELRAEGPGRVTLMRMWVDDPAGRWTPATITPADFAGSLDSLADGGGWWGVESLGDPPRPARWSDATAWLSLPGGRGRWVLTLCAPRPEPARLRVTAPALGVDERLEVGPQWRELVVPIASPNARVLLHVTVDNPFTPGGADRRSLGVACGELRFERAH